MKIKDRKQSENKAGYFHRCQRSWQENHRATNSQRTIQITFLLSLKAVSRSSKTSLTPIKITFTRHVLPKSNAWKHYA